MSVMCSSPSIPPISTNAPYSVRFLTMPVRTLPSSRCCSVLPRFSDCSSSRSCLRETTMLPRFLLSLMMATSIVWPFMPSRFRMGRRSTCAPARNVEMPPSFHALHDDALDRLLFVVSALDLAPRSQPMRLQMREVDVALFGFALLPHYVDLIAGLELRLALVIESLGNQHHAFGFRSDIDDDVGRGQFHHAAFDYVVVANRFLGFGLEVVEGSREIIAASRGILGG